MYGADLAQVTVEHQERIAKGAVKPTESHDFTIIVWSGERSFRYSFTGIASEAVSYMTETLGIDMANGRWARGHEGRCDAASDGKAEQAWLAWYGKR